MTSSCSSVHSAVRAQYIRPRCFALRRQSSHGTGQHRDRIRLPAIAKRHALTQILLRSSLSSYPRVHPILCCFVRHRRAAAAATPHCDRPARTRSPSPFAPPANHALQPLRPIHKRLALRWPQHTLREHQAPRPSAPAPPADASSARELRRYRPTVAHTRPPQPPTTRSIPASPFT